MDLRGTNAPRTNSPGINKKRFDNRRQWTCPDKLFCPAASYGPCEVKGLSYLWPGYNIRAQVKEDTNLCLPDCQPLYELTKKETDALITGVPQNQKDVSSENMLQTNEYNLEELQTSASELQTNIVSVEGLQTSPSCAGELQKKRMDDYEKALIHLPKIVPQSQHFLLKSASLTSRSAVLNCEEPWSLTPWVEGDSEDESIEEEVTCIVEQNKREIKKYESFQASASQYARPPKIGRPKQSHLQKTRYSLKQLKSSVLPFPPLGEED